MPVPEMLKAIERLRMLLSVIRDKDEELRALRRDFRRQLDRAPNYAIHSGNSLDASLGAMNEIQERLNGVDVTLDHLSAITTRAEQELHALSLTNKIEEAKVELGELEAKGNPTEDTLKQVQELRRFIEEGSIRAGQTITGEVENDARPPAGGDTEGG